MRQAVDRLIDVLVIPLSGHLYESGCVGNLLLPSVPAPVDGGLG